MAKIALLIGVSDYEPGLDALPSAVNDVLALQQVLINPEMGEFADGDVTVLQNPDRQTMETAIYNLFANRAKDDLVLLYFSGHGVVDEGGEFYFASRYSRKENGRLVPPTAVAARSVRDWLEQSRSQHKVLILDSCFSGAFARGVKAKDSGSVNPEQFLGGKGTAILTASNSTQYALAQEGFDLSVYTHYLVEGIRTGGADQDDDGWIAMEELHAYASSKVKEAAPAMSPEFYPVKEGYKILLAKSPKNDPSLKYRKQVEQRADRGKFSIPARRLLNSLRLQLGLTTEVAEAIEAEVLQPYRDYQRKLQEYEETLVEALQTENPLSQRTLNDLKDYQQHLGLLDEDVVPSATVLVNPVTGKSPSATVFVNPATGHDRGSGTQASPFKTIGRALQQARPGTVIQIAPGTYSITSGEVFPIKVPSGVTIVGSEANKGSGTLISGSGIFASPTFANQNVTFQLANNTQLRGVTVTNPETRGTGVWVESTNPTITNNTFTNCKREGVFATGTANPLVAGNVAIQNAASGFSITRNSKGEWRQNFCRQTGFGIAVGDSAAPLLAENQISENRAGIVINKQSKAVLRGNVVQNNTETGLVVTETALPDLGNSQAPGGNIFRQNGQFDIQNGTTVSLISVGNQVDPAKVQGAIDFVGNEIPTPY